MKKALPLVALVAIVAAVVLFYQNNAKHTHSVSTNDTTQSTNKTQALTVVTPWEITSVDPSTSGFVYQRLQLAETLVDADERANLVPALALSWTSNAEANEWTFSLRPDVKFHDGTLLNADNVVQSIKVALSKPSALEKAGISDVQKIDEMTVKFVLHKPLQAFPAYLAHATAMILAASSFNEAGEVVQIVGTGPYQVVKIEPPQKVEQTAFADYWGQKAQIQHIHYLANSRSESRTLLVQSQPNYLVFNLDAPSLSRLNNDPNIHTQSKSIARTIQYKVNAKAAPFDDVKVRQILSRAIDRQGIAESVLKIQNGVAEQLLPPLFADWQLDVAAQKPDYPALKAELVALGFALDAQGNLLDKQGKQVHFTLKTFSDRPELPVVATALQEQFGRLGILVDVAVGNFSEIPASHQNGTLQMALYARNYGLIPNPLGVLMEDFDQKGSDWGVMNWQNDALNQALVQLNGMPDGADTKMLKQEIARIIYEEQPITPIIYYQQNVAAHKSLQGLKLDALERSFYLNELSW